MMPLWFAALIIGGQGSGMTFCGTFLTIQKQPWSVAGFCVQCKFVISPTRESAGYIAEINKPR